MDSEYAFKRCLNVVSETPLGQSDALSIPNPYILSLKIFYEHRNEDNNITD